MTQAPLILPMPGNETFARQLAKARKAEVGQVETRRFPDGETYLRLLTPVAARTGAPWVVMEKTRRGDFDVSVALPALNDHGGRIPVLVDDIASSGRTMLAAAQLLAARGLARPVCAVVHPLFAGDAFARLQQVAARVVSCDSLPHPSNAISLAPLLAEALATLPDRP